MSPGNFLTAISPRLKIALDFRPLLKEVKKAGEVHIVLDCSTEKIQAVLKQALQVGMMTAYHNYLITSLVSLPSGQEVDSSYDQNHLRPNMFFDVKMSFWKL